MRFCGATAFENLGWQAHRRNARELRREVGAAERDHEKEAQRDRRTVHALATATPGTVQAGERPITVTWLAITDVGRQAVAGT